MIVNQEEDNTKQAMTKTINLWNATFYLKFLKNHIRDKVNLLMNFKKKKNMKLLTNLIKYKKDLDQTPLKNLKKLKKKKKDFIILHSKIQWEVL